MLKTDPIIDKIKEGELLPREEISPQFIAIICKRLELGKRVRRKLPEGGLLHLDRQLPFLCVYRLPEDTEIDAGTSELITGQASILLVPGNRKLRHDVTALVRGIATTMRSLFDSFLIVEIWAEDTAANGNIALHNPTFRIVAPKKTPLSSTIGRFETALGAVSIQGARAEVEVTSEGRVYPPGFQPLLPTKIAAEIGCHFLGIAVRPVYRDKDKKVFPVVLRNMRRRVTRACQRGIFDFVQNHTFHRPAHFHALGPRAMVKLVWNVDTQLAQVSNSFDFLLVSTPTNIGEAWSQFKRSKYKNQPKFHYRSAPFDPIILKRQLYQIPIENIEDPTIADLFLRQQQALDRKITMIQDRNTSRFLYGSLQAYGDVSDKLLAVAVDILERLPRHSREASATGKVDATAFERFAKDELEFLRVTHPEMSNRVEVRNDIVGLMVSSGNLLIGADTSVPISRVPALLAHEIGTHMITYLNGRAQKFKQLYIGLPGYDEMQEGLAVLAEYLVGGLSKPRIRLLAARVVGAKKMTGGASFIEVFGELNETYGFAKRTAFSITTRLFRSGGLTKDAVYLRGLISLLDYLKNNGRLEPLYIGKFALTYLPLIEELQSRHILGPSPFRPRFLDDPAALARLERTRKGLTVLELLQES